MKIFIYLKFYLAWILGFFAFPKKCICCDSVAYAIPLCASCQKLFYTQLRQHTARCKICGKLLISEHGICLNCREERLTSHIDRTFSIAPYLLWKKDLLFEWKTAGNRNLGFFFTHILAEVISREFPNIPLVPVPARPQKIKIKGWDQIADLSYYLKMLYKIRIVPVLERVSEFEQKKRNRAERIAGLGSTYILNNRIKNLNQYPCVLLLDDIITTGATLETCAAVLKQAGVKKIYALTLFYC